MFPAWWPETTVPKWTTVPKRRTGSGKVKPKVRARVYKRDGHRCVKCGATRKLTIDHIVPKSRGGGNGEHNLQTMCRPCNNAKGDS